MSELEHAHQHAHDHHHACANLFGCGDEKGTGIIREDIKDAAFDNRASDRLLHTDHVDQGIFASYLSARGRWRRKFLQASSFMGVLAAVAGVNGGPKVVEHMAMGVPAFAGRQSDFPHADAVVLAQ